MSLWQEAWRTEGPVGHSCMVMYDGHGAKGGIPNKKERDKDKEWETEKEGQDNSTREGKGTSIVEEQRQKCGNRGTGGEGKGCRETS